MTYPFVRPPSFHNHFWMDVAKEQSVWDCCELLSLDTYQNDVVYFWIPNFPYVEFTASTSPYELKYAVKTSPGWSIQTTSSWEGSRISQVVKHLWYKLWAGILFAQRSSSTFSFLGWSTFEATKDRVLCSKHSHPSMIGFIFPLNYSHWWPSLCYSWVFCWIRGFHFSCSAPSVFLLCPAGIGEVSISDAELTEPTGNDS